MIAALLLAAAASFQLLSGDVSDGGTIPLAFKAIDCGGKNAVPHLRWTGAPAGTKSFALVMHDPDAPLAGGFDHWIVYDLPASAHALDAAATGGAVLGRNSLGKAAYYGPCPPPGPAHRYVFTLYALDVAHVGDDAPLDAARLAKAIEGHVVATATLTAKAGS